MALQTGKKDVGDGQCLPVWRHLALRGFAAAPLFPLRDGFNAYCRAAGRNCGKGGWMKGSADFFSGAKRARYGVFEGEFR